MTYVCAATKLWHWTAVTVRSLPTGSEPAYLDSRSACCPLGVQQPPYNSIPVMASLAIPGPLLLASRATSPDLMYHLFWLQVSHWSRSVMFRWINDIPSQQSALFMFAGCVRGDAWCCCSERTGTASDFQKYIWDNIILNVQRDATICSLYFILLQHQSTCFGCRPRPSSGVHKTVVTAAGTSHISRLVWKA